MPRPTRSGPSVTKVKKTRSRTQPAAASSSLNGVGAAVQLDRSFGYLFKQAHRAFTRALDRRLKSHGITLAQWYFLRELWVKEDITQRELSRRMDVSEPTTAVAINQMEKAGLIERERDPSQRNSVRVRLTAEGRGLQKFLLPIAGDVNARAAQGLKPAGLDAARQSIMAMIENLNAELDADLPPGPSTAKPSTSKRGG